jgi:hypothetical protein
MSTHHPILSPAAVVRNINTQIRELCVTHPTPLQKSPSTYLIIKEVVGYKEKEGGRIHLKEHNVGVFKPRVVKQREQNYREATMVPSTYIF